MAGGTRVCWKQWSVGPAAHELEGRATEPAATVIDSQSVKTTESGATCGYDSGKKTKGRKRHIVTDVLGLLLKIVVHAVRGQDRDGAPDLLKAVGKKFPRRCHIFADGGYAGDNLRQAMGDECTLEIVKRPNKAKGFVLSPRRWVVERAFAWPGRYRRLVKDWERTIESSTAWALVASICLVTRRLTSYCYVNKTLDSGTYSGLEFGSGEKLPIAGHFRTMMHAS